MQRYLLHFGWLCFFYHFAISRFFGFRGTFLSLGVASIVLIVFGCYPVAIFDWLEKIGELFFC